jgi:uncharacterized spore protein YtfJ
MAALINDESIVLTVLDVVGFGVGGGGGENIRSELVDMAIQGNGGESGMDKSKGHEVLASWVWSREWRGLLRR